MYLSQLDISYNIIWFYRLLLFTSTRIFSIEAWSERWKLKTHTRGVPVSCSSLKSFSKYHLDANRKNTEHKISLSRAPEIISNCQLCRHWSQITKAQSLFKFKHALFCRKVTWWQELFYRISKSSLGKTHLTRHQNTFALQGHHTALYDSNSLLVMKIINLFYKLVVVLSRILCMITSIKIYKDSHSDFITPSTKTSQLSWPSSVDGKSERRLTEASSATCWRGCRKTEFSSRDVLEGNPGSSVSNLAHFLSLAWTKVGYKRNPRRITTPLTKNVRIEARHITRTSNNAGGRQSSAAPNVCRGTL